MDRYSDMAVLVAVVDARGFSPAARQLNMTHSALSKRVQRLEERLGVQLLLRTTRQMSLTEAGELYVGEAREILETIRALELSVVSESETLRGQLKISASNVFGRYHVVPMLVDFMKAHPDIKVDLVLTDDFVDIRREKIDVAIRLGEMGTPGAVSCAVGVSERVICAAPEYLHRFGQPSNLADLAKHICLGLNFETSFNDWGVSQSSGRALTFSDRFSCNSVEALYAVCLAGEGVSQLPTYIVKDDIKSGRLHRLFEGVFTPPSSTVYAVRSESNFVPGKTRALIAFLQERFRAYEGV
ncbi:LysR family transcriptional regulator [Pseudomonas sp. App30]|uniref:LysR family transcriptional regulator n=1 Tax=Pseudomonas sp. App30 TaxID=3068990 RepID=UPI003A7FDF3F